MAYDYKNELNKKCTPADVKFVDKYIAPKITESYKTARNPMTEAEFETTPLIATLVQFTQELAYSDFRLDILRVWGVPDGQKIQLYDRARYLILKLDNDIYMNVID